jgi:hypothetical protein
MLHRGQLVWGSDRGSGRIRSIGIGRQHPTQPHCNSMKRHDDSTSNTDAMQFMMKESDV